MFDRNIYLVAFLFTTFVSGIGHSQTNNFLTDELQTEEVKIAQDYFETIHNYNAFSGPLHGTVGLGNTGIIKSYEFFSQKYKQKISQTKYEDSFDKTGHYELVQLYSAPIDSIPDIAEGIRKVFFEFSVWFGEEDMTSKIFMGGAAPENSGASKRYFYGFMDFVTEGGVLKIDAIQYSPEFPFGGGHQPYRESAEYMAQNSLGENYSNDDMDTSKCETQVIHQGRLVFVTCPDSQGKNPQTAKMVYPSNSADGWICIGTFDKKPTITIESTHLTTGKELALKNDFNDAVTEYQKSINENPKDFKAYELMGYAYYRLKQTNKAVESLKKCISLNSDFLLGHYNLALADWDAGDQTSAIDEVKTVIELDANYKEIIKSDLQFKKFNSTQKFKDLLK